MSPASRRPYLHTRQQGGAGSLHVECLRHREAVVPEPCDIGLIRVLMRIQSVSRRNTTGIGQVSFFPNCHQVFRVLTHKVFTRYL